MPRLNRVDPYGDLHRTPERGLFTGNRGCLVDDRGRVTRHHNGWLWITCVTSYKDWKSPLDQPRHWTPLFFLDDAVALAAGHRPCGLCRRNDYMAYRQAVRVGLGTDEWVSATDLNRMLSRERLERGKGVSRARDRKPWGADIGDLPSGVVIACQRRPRLVTESLLLEFGFGGWSNPVARPANGTVAVLTPPVSVLALANGFSPTLHRSALLDPMSVADIAEDPRLQLQRRRLASR